MTSLLEQIAKLFQGVKLWVVVRPWEVCIRVRLGKHTTVLQPGVHLRIPMADETIAVNTRLRIAAVPSQTITTTDGKTVTIGGSVGYKIVDPLEAMLALAQPHNTCPALVQAAISEYVADNSSSAITIPELEYHACTALNGRIKGIEVEFVRVVDYAVVKTFRLLQESWRPETSGHQEGETKSY